MSWALVCLLLTASPVDRGVAYLKSLQKSDGSFWAKGGYRGRAGSTARVLHAFAVSGVAENDKAVQRALGSLRWAKPAYTMRVHLIHALAHFDAKKHRARIHELAEGLLTDPVQWADAPSRRGATALSALAAAHKCGFDVPASVWRSVKESLREVQGPHGRWIGRTVRPKPHPNTPVSPTTSAHTAFYLTSYLLAVSELDSREAAWRTEPARKALRFLLAHGIDERFRFNDLWFDPLFEDAHEAQVRYLVKAQRPDGSWVGEYGYPMNSTVRALVALARRPELDMATARRFAMRPDEFPHLHEPGGVRRAFDLYVTYQPERRAEVAAQFGRAGPTIIGYLVRKMHDENVAIRATAYGLLSRLLAREFAFDPRAEANRRLIMLRPIVTFWERDGVRLRWDAQRKKFAVPR